MGKRGTVKGMQGQLITRAHLSVAIGKTYPQPNRCGLKNLQITIKRVTQLRLKEEE